MKYSVYLTVKFLWGHRKIGLTLLLSIIMATLFIASTVFNLNSLIDTYYNAEVARVGSHHTTFYNVNEEQEKVLRNITNADVGFAKTKGEGTISGFDGPVYIGAVDESFVEIGKINYAEGNPPCTNKSISVEKFLADICKIKVGDSVSLAMDDQCETYEVVGIFDNYTGVWSSWGEGRSASSSFPQIITQYNEDETGYNHAIVRFSGAYTDTHFSEINQITYQLKANMVVDNNELFTSQTFDEIMHLTITKHIVISCIALAVFLAVYNLLKLYSNTVIPSNRIMQHLGYTIKTCSTIYAYQIIGILLLGLFIGFGATYLASCLLRSTWDWVSPSIVLIIAVLVFSANQLKFESNLNGMSKIKKRGNYVPLSNQCVMVGLNNICIGYNEYIYSVISISICIAVFSFGIQYRSELALNTTSDIDYTVTAPRMITSYDVDGYDMLFDSETCITWDAYDRIKKLDGAVTITGTPFTRGTVLRTSNGDIVNNLDFVFLNSNQYELISKANESCDISIHDFCVLFSPQYGYSNDVTLTKSAQLEYIQYIEREGASTYEDGAEYAGRMIANEIDIKAIIKGNFEMEYGNISIYKSEPTLVMSEEYVRTHNLFPGYHVLDIESTADKSVSLYGQLRNAVASIPNSIVFSTNEYFSRNERLAVLMYEMLFISSFILGGLGVFATSICFYVKIIVNKKSYGIYRILGLNKKSMAFSLIFENIVYLIASAIIAFAMLAMFSMLIGWGDYYLIYIRSLMIAVFVISIGSQVLLLYPIRRILSEELATMIAYEE